MARKPLRGTVAANVLRHGTGALNIDGTRIPSDRQDTRHGGGIAGNGTSYELDPDARGYDLPSGRWPANVILTDPIFDGGVEGVVGGGEVAGSTPGSFQREMTSRGYEGGGLGQRRAADHDPVDLGKPGYGDSGTYSRFFLIPKSARAEREPVLGGLPLRRGGSMEGGVDTRTGLPVQGPTRANVHPTVKPLDLMRHLVRLVTPPGGVVLDPFLGSGTTALAAEMEGFAWIGIEKEAEYIAITEARLNGTQRGLGLGA